jgi:hypothetical protein
MGSLSGNLGAPHATAPGVFRRLHTTLSLQAAVLDGLGRGQDAQEVRGWLAANPVPPGSLN